MTLKQDELESILVAVLAVNLFTLDKAYALLPALNTAGLLQPSNVANMDLGDLIIRLDEAGFRRGGLMGMMASRYQSVMRAASEGVLDTVGELIRKGETQQATAILLGVKGVGPSVAANAILMISSC